MTRARWAGSALADFAAHIAWVESHDPIAAQRLRDRIDRRAEWLVDFPRAGALVGRGRARSFGVLGTPYVIIYRPLRDTVVILRIRHARQNWR